MIPLASTMGDAPIAQRIEHRSSEPRVVGSNPSRRATFEGNFAIVDTTFVVPIPFLLTDC